VRSNILWNDVVALMKNLGSDVTERAGSRVAFTLGGRTIVLHRPHPGKETRPYGVNDLRDFLVEAGVTP
jgi:HicA toxin of bacterial toxin-antitoxin,